MRLLSEERRLQIVLQATRLISISGYNAVSLADIARACEISKSSVLHHFPSMVRLLEAVLVHWDAANDTITARLQDAAATPAFGLTILTDVVKRNRLQPELVRLYMTLGAEALSINHPAHAYFRTRRMQALQVLTELLSWKQDPSAAALEMLAFWHGMEWHWLWDPEMDIQEAWSRFSTGFFTRPAKAGR